MTLQITQKWNDFFINTPTWDFWPYINIFHKENLLFDDVKQTRWSQNFPFKSSFNNNTEIFLSLDFIYICPWERSNIAWEKQKFIDIIHIKTLDKIRIYIEELSLIYNTIIDNRNILVINYLDKLAWKTIYFDIETLKITTDFKQKLSYFTM